MPGLLAQLLGMNGRAPTEPDLAPPRPRNAPLVVGDPAAGRAWARLEGEFPAIARYVHELGPQDPQVDEQGREITANTYVDELPHFANIWLDPTMAARLPEREIYEVLGHEMGHVSQKLSPRSISHEAVGGLERELSDRPETGEAPMPKQYTVKDNSSGKTVTFDWHGEGEPTDADMEEVFATAGSAPAAADAFDSVPPSTLEGLESLTPDQRRTMKAEGSGQLPGLGATFGSIAGVPGAVIGGALGTLGRDLLRANAGDPRTPRTGVDAAMNVGTEAATQGAIQKVAQVLPGALTRLGGRMYQGALKPTQAIADKAHGGVEQLVKTGLEEGVTVSRGGLRKVDTVLDRLDDQVSAAIKGSGRVIDPRNVVRELRQTVKEFADQVNPQADLQAIGHEGRAFMSGKGSKPIPIEKAQELKQGTYRRLSKDFGKISAPSAEAQKALARGLRKEIADAVPEIAPLNQRASRLIDLRKALDRTRTGNTDTVGLRDVAAMSGGKLALLASLLQRAPAQSMLGRGAYRAGQSINPDVLATAVRALVASLPDQ